MWKHARTTLLAALTILLVSASAWAMTLEEAARKVARDYNARVLSAKTITVDGRRVHEIRIVTKDGTVQTVRIPATG